MKWQMTMVACVSFGVAPGLFAELAVQADFPGGSVEVLEINQEERSVVVDPALYEDRGWRCWWYFQLKGMEPGEPVTVEVGPAPWATPARAAWQVEGEEVWRQTEVGTRTGEGKRIIYSVQLPEGSKGNAIRMAWGPVFGAEDATALVEEAAARLEGAEEFELCKTREGRSTPALRVGGGEEGKVLVWVQARQHAWESGSSWVAKGFTEWLVSDDEQAKALRERAEVCVVPVMDIDNVYRGAGGKGQKPQDHNRDWTESPHWRSVAAAQAQLRAADEEGRLALFIDLHNPDTRTKFPYFYTPGESLMTERGTELQDSFLAAVKVEMTKPLRFLGTAVPSGEKYDPRAWKGISKNWVKLNCGEEVVSVTLETAWNTQASTAEGYETVGRQLGLAVERYFRERDLGG